MTILWWQWMLVGLALMFAELATPGGFYLLFFGIAAVIVGGLASVDIAGSLPVQLLLFSGVAVASLLLFRNRLLQMFQADPQRPPVDQLVGEIGTATETLAPGDVGRVELRGTTWSARNRGGAVLTVGQRVRVVGVDGLLLFVDQEGAS